MTVKCNCCGWTGPMDTLESEVVKQGLEKISKCPECGSSSRHYLEVIE